MTNEQRRFIRVNSRLTTFVKLQETGRVERALTKNLGGGGVCFVTEDVLEIGTPLEVEVKLPDRDRPIAFQGVVAWSQLVAGPDQNPRRPTIETGVRFLSIDPKDRATLVQYATLNAVAPERSPPDSGDLPR